MKLLPTVLLAIALIVSACLIMEGLTALGTGDRYVTVKGVAEREVQADLALWPLRFVATGNSLADAQASARASREAIMAFLKLQAIDTDSVTLQRLDVADSQANPYQNTSGQQRFTIRQTLMVRSDDIARIQQAAQGISELVNSGVALSAANFMVPRWDAVRLVAHAVINVAIIAIVAALFQADSLVDLRIDHAQAGRMLDAINTGLRVTLAIIAVLSAWELIQDGRRLARLRRLRA